MAFGDLKVQDLIYEDSSNNEITVVLADLVPKHNPTFTGTVTVPTAPASDVSTKAASTAFVDAYYATKSGASFTGAVTGTDLTLSGNLVVNGTTTTINTQTLDVEDHNITLGKVTTPSDTTANNGGITLKGASDKTFNWLNATDAWTSSEHLHLLNLKNLILGTDSHSTLSYLHGSSTTRLINRNTYVDVIDDGTAAGSIKLAVDGGNQFFINERGFVAPQLGTVGMQWAPALNQDTVLGVRGRGSSTSNLAVVDLTSSQPSVSGGDVKYGKIRFSWDNTSQVHDNGTAIIEGCSGAASSSSDRATALKFYTAPTGSAGGYAALPVERLRIWKDGQIGLGGANYGSSGEVLTSGGSGAAPSWAAVPAGGNTFEIVADGAIGAGKAVQIKSNGKVEEVKETVTEANLVQKINNAGIQDDSVNNPRLAYDDVGRYLLHTWMANESGYEWTYYRLYILNSTGTGWTYGNQTKLISTTYNQQPDHVKVIAEPNQGKFVMFSGKDRSDSNKKAAWVGTPDSGGNITWSNKNTVDTSTYETNKSDMCFDSTNDMVVAAYAVYNTGLKYVAGTMSNSGTMTWGSATTVQSGSGNSIGNVSVDYDSTTNRIVVIYKYENPNGGNRYGKMKIGQRTSANTITWGSEIEWHGYDFAQAGLACAGGKVIITFSDVNDNRKLKYRVGTLSSSANTVTWGTTADTGLANHSFYNDLCYVPSVDKLVLSYTVSPSNTNSGNDDSRLAKGAISGTSITWSNSTEFDSSRLASPHIISFTGALGTTYGGIAHTGSRHSNGAGYQYVWHTASATSNLSRQKVVGFAPSAISDGATGTINTDGNTVTVSGLTAGTKYYVQESGALGTGTTDSGGSNLEAGGVALSANKLLIKLHH